MLLTVKHLVATAQTSISFIFCSKINLNIKQITAYFVWLKIDFFPRKSIFAEFSHNAAFRGQNFEQILKLPATNRNIPHQ